MDNRPIAFFDSGVGGLPYLEWATKHLPNETFTYLADSSHFPYGEKTVEEVREYVLSGIRLIRRIADPKLVVVACNTASVVALEELRKEFSLPFVGVVPAIKVAAERPGCKKIALLATSITVDDDYSQNLIHSYADKCEVVRVAGRELVRFVENELVSSDASRIRSALRPVVEVLKSHKVDSVVLGCTHFTLLDRALEQEMGEGVAIIDSREGVGHQIVRLLETGGLAAAHKATDRFYLTGEADDRYREFARRYGLVFSGKAA